MAVLFSLPGYEAFARQIQKKSDVSWGEMTVRSFPDGESLVTVSTDVKDKEVIVVCGLEHANQQAMPLMFFAHTVKELGAKRVTLVAPYLGYMRQDKRFASGEAISSAIFAKFISSCVDALITIDPHLHRYKTLDEIYTIPTTVLHAAAPIGSWIGANVENAVLIGPDQESRQWVAQVAESAGVPFLILEKIRRGDREVKISLPDDIEKYKGCTPVVLDDIIATAHTMIETVKQLEKAGRLSGMKRPVCIGIHALFVDDAYERLQNAGVAKIVTTNTIVHETNEIDIAALFLKVIPEVF